MDDAFATDYTTNDGASVYYTSYTKPVGQRVYRGGNEYISLIAKLPKRKPARKRRIVTMRGRAKKLTPVFELPKSNVKYPFNPYLSKICNRKIEFPYLKEAA